jgi:hypothetical protein
MKRLTGILFLFLCLSCLDAKAQIFGKKDENGKKERRKFYQSTNGLLIGYERGRNDYFQLGYSYNWKKISLKKAVIRSVDGFVEYSFWENVLGMKAAYWQRHGNLNWTYGVHGGYFTDFGQLSLSLGPSVGFRILGFHGQAGYNFLLNGRDIEANRLYLSVNYLIPYHSKLSTKKGRKEKTIFKW